MASYTIIKNRILKFSANYLYSLHSHAHVEIIYIMSGNCMLAIDNIDTALNAGDCIVIAANALHNFYVNGSSGCKINQLEITTDLPLNDSSFIKLRFAHLAATCLNNILAYSNEAMEDDDISKLISLELDKLAILCGYPVQSSLANSKILTNAINLIRDNYTHDITCRAISHTLGISERYLRRVFEMNIGTTPKEYITNLKMEQAKTLLINSNNTIAEISGLVGYNTIQYFSELFHSRIGVTPSQFRSLHTKIAQLSDYTN